MLDLSWPAETFRTLDWTLLLKYSVPFSSMGNTVEKDGGGGGLLTPISIFAKDLQSPFVKGSHLLFLLETGLPTMAEIFKREDWSLLEKFSSMDSKLNIEDALKSELAAICVWILFTKVPPHVKAAAARSLSFMSIGTSKSERLTIDEMGVENSLVHILCSGNAEVQRQVCMALALLGSCPDSWLAIPFCAAGIQDVLLHLVCNFGAQNQDETYPVLEAISTMACNLDSMREKIVKAELLHSWLVKLLGRKDDEAIMKSACWTISEIANKRFDCKEWVHVSKNILPEIFYITGITHVQRLAVCVISRISKYGSSDKIKDLVEMGVLNVLISVCSESESDEVVLEECLDTVEIILKAADAKDKVDKYWEDDELEKDNEYADMIDDIDILFQDYQYIWGWHVLLLNFTCMLDTHPLVKKAERIVHRYRPDLDHVPCWDFFP